MRVTLTIGLAAMLTAFGCGAHVGGSGGGDDGPPPPNPDGWQINVDMSGLQRFVPVGTATWPVAGTATASQGLAGVSVAGMPVTVDGSGAFSADVAVAPGLTPVPIAATDLDGNVRKADRSLLEASFRAEGDANPDGAQLVLSDAILAAMGSTLAGDTSSIDVAGQIMSRPYLSQDSQCSTWPVQASQGTVTVEVVADQGVLTVHVQIPDLYVYFEGDCQGLISQIPIAGQMQGTIDLTTQLEARAPTGGAACVTGFDHSTPQVAVSGWQFDVWGTGGPLQNWIIALFSGSKSAEAEQQLSDEMQTESDAMLTDKLSNLTVFDSNTNLTLLGQPIAMSLCLGGLDGLVAHVASSVTGPSGRDAPGAPQLGGALVTPAPGELLLDADLVSQLLYAAWRGGGLSKPDVMQVPMSLLGALVPALPDAYPEAQNVDVSIDGELPPVVRASSEGGGDLQVELGDLMLRLSVGGDEVFRFGVHLTLDLALVPQGGALVPTVLATHADVALLGERFDAPDDALEGAVKLEIADAAASLLAGATLTLPALPGLGAPVDVTPDPGGRYLHVTLQ